MGTAGAEGAEDQLGIITTVTPTTIVTTTVTNARVLFQSSEQLHHTRQSTWAMARI
jgi:hypothetical protein